MMFAQILPEPSHYSSIGWACVIVVCIIAGINQAFALWHWVKDKPTGGEVMAKAHEIFATKPEMATVKTELSKRIEDVDEDLQAQKKSIVDNGDKRKASIEGKVEGVRTELKKDIENVSKDVAATNKELGQVQGELKQINLTMMNVNSSLQQLHVQQAKHHGKE